MSTGKGSSNNGGEHGSFDCVTLTLVPRKRRAEVNVALYLVLFGHADEIRCAGSASSTCPICKLWSWQQFETSADVGRLDATVQG
jgi:hypothetical protein